MRIIKGKPVADRIHSQTDLAVAALKDIGVQPKLVVLVPTQDESTAWYVRSITRVAERRGIVCESRDMFSASADEIGACLRALSEDSATHGIICQTPLPEGVGLSDVAPSIVPEKDIDGANPESMGRLIMGMPAFPPATAQAVIEILRSEKVPLSGANVVVIGRSIIVGKPVSMLLLAENATVTICHSRSRDLPEICKRADILVAAVGRAELLGAEHVGRGTVIVDVGTNPTNDGGLVGDVDQAAVEPMAAALTPVPGGVGTVTTALLLKHVAQAAKSVSSQSGSTRFLSNDG